MLEATPARVSLHRSAERPVGQRAALPAAVRRRFDPDQLYGLRLTLFAIAFLLVFIPFGLLLEAVLGKGSLVRFDTAAARCSSSSSPR